MGYYDIVRFYQKHERELIRTGLSLDEAQAHCSHPETSSSTCTSAEGLARTAEKGPWFDGYLSRERRKSAEEPLLTKLAQVLAEESRR